MGTSNNLAAAWQPKACSTRALVLDLFCLTSARLRYADGPVSYVMDLAVVVSLKCGLDFIGTVGRVAHTHLPLFHISSNQPKAWLSRTLAAITVYLRSFFQIS